MVKQLEDLWQSEGGVEALSLLYQAIPLPPRLQLDQRTKVVQGIADCLMGLTSESHRPQRESDCYRGTIRAVV